MSFLVSSLFNCLAPQRENSQEAYEGYRLTGIVNRLRDTISTYVWPNSQGYSLPINPSTDEISPEHEVFQEDPSAFLLEETSLWNAELYSLPAVPSLEATFPSSAFPEKLDTDAPCGFAEYLEPNEGNPQNVQPLLERKSPGFLVSTGTERSFFDLLFSGNWCFGLIVRDINPRVKAYVDFNVLLLKISKDCEDYRYLSTIPEYSYLETEISKRVESIRQEIENGEMSPIEKKYYLEHLEAFAPYYYRHSEWKSCSYSSSRFREVQYQQNPQLFGKLQKFAKEGKIIATLGDINDLADFENVPISVVDVSNISDYILIDIRHSHSPSVIWTHQCQSNTTYRIAQPLPLFFEERKVFNELFTKLEEAKVFSSQHEIGRDFQRLLDLEVFPGPNRECLEKLQESIKPYLLNFPEIGYVFLPPLSSQSLEFSKRSAVKLNECSESVLRRICLAPETRSHLPHIISHWKILSPSVYAAFSQADGWAECFQEYYEKYKDNPQFIKYFEKNPELRFLLENARGREAKGVVA